MYTGDLDTGGYGYNKLDKMLREHRDKLIAAYLRKQDRMKKLLEVFSEVGDWKSVNDVVEETKLKVGYVSKYLKKFEKMGLLVSTKVGNYRMYALTSFGSKVRKILFPANRAESSNINFYRRYSGW